MIDLIANRFASLQIRSMTTQLIDATALAPATRHPRIFETFDALAVGESFVLENDHYPLPLLHQFHAERPDQFDWSVLAAGPRFRVLISKRDSREPRGTNEYLTWDHARLDALMDEVNRLVEQESFDDARARFATFAYGLSRHIVFEETLVFPLFEARAPGAGPIPVMRAEHEHIKELLHTLATALDEHDGAAFHEHVEMLLSVLGEHNMKEEHMLYPSFDRLTSDTERGDVVRRMQLTPP